MFLPFYHASDVFSQFYRFFLTPLTFPQNFHTSLTFPHIFIIFEIFLTCLHFSHLPDFFYDFSHFFSPASPFLALFTFSYVFHFLLTCLTFAQTSCFFSHFLTHLSFSHNSCFFFKFLTFSHNVNFFSHFSLFLPTPQSPSLPAAGHIHAIRIL